MDEYELEAPRARLNARETDAFDLGDFNSGSYPESVAEKNTAEQITMVLYPNDSSENGKELRLKQEYFLVSATLQDCIARHLMMHPDLRNLADGVAFQLNDTHPALAVAELMRILVDEQGFQWAHAWEGRASRLCRMGR